MSALEKNRGMNVLEKNSFIVILILTLISFLSLTQCVEGNENPNANDCDCIAVETDDYPFHRPVTLGLIGIYQRFISPIKATSCPMSPSCSRYAYDSFKHYNPFNAFAMTADRLHRCGHDLDNYETVEVSGNTRFFDPPLNGIPKKISIYPSLQISTKLNVLGSNISADILDGDARLFNYAEVLESERKYNEAIIEYRRLISYFPASPYSKQAMKSVLRCYYKTEQYLSAIQWGEGLLKGGEFVEEDNEIKFFIGLSYFKLGNYQFARDYFAEIKKDKDDFKGESILLEGLSYAKEDKWEKAEKIFAQIKPDSKFYNNAEQAIKLSGEGKNLRKKNPVIAGVLSIIPGLGYLYSGYEQTALASFIVNGLFMWGTAEAFKQKNEGLGITLGIFSLGWYSGNIYGSVKSAQRSNIKAKNDLLFRFDFGFEY